MLKIISAAFILVLSTPVWAGEASVVKAEVHKQASGTYTISATVLHADAGWDHYANRWEVLGDQDKVLATRVLLHPHETEQPFTRSLSNIHIPKGTPKIKLRAHDMVHGYGGKMLTISLAP